eukprot:jgi/Tetstr1/453574/TSEL_040542.t1
MAVFSLGASGDDAISVQVVDEEYVLGVRSMYAQDISGCLLPLSSVVKDLQDAGALALLLYEFISQEFLGDAVRSSRRVFVRLPQLAGVAPGSSRVGGESLWAIIVAAVLGGMLALCGIGCIAYCAIRRKQAARPCGRHGEEGEGGAIEAKQLMPEGLQ